MRIFDPKDQFGNAILSSADTQKSSVKLEKQMAVGGGAITLTSTDISDIENWELSNARVKVDGQMVSFLPDTSRDTDGNLVITLGETFSDVVLVLKRTVFDGMKQEEEEITIEVKIQQLMAKTMAAATAPTKREEDEIEANIREWKALGVKAYNSDPEGKYKNATRDSLSGYRISGTGEVVVDDCLISVDTVVDESWQGMDIDQDVDSIKWRADLPCLREVGSMQLPVEYITEWTGKIPNLTDSGSMFANCSGLTSWTVELPNSITNTSYMFQNCSGLTSWTVELPNSLENASGMFYGCTGLTSWNVALPNSLTQAYGMFYGCTGLTSWSVALPNSITNAEGMFNGCSSLTSFQSDMPTGLTANTYWMFWVCKLDIESVERISRTIAFCTGTSDWNKTIHLGVSQACRDNTNFQTYINAMKGKGWTVAVGIN